MVNDNRQYMQSDEVAQNKQACGHAKQEMLFGCLIDEFMIHQRYQVKQSTYSHYMNLIDTHIRPQFGGLLVNELSANMIEEYADKKLTKGRLNQTGGLAPKTVKDLLSLLRLIIKYGIARDLIDQRVLFFSGPKVPKKEIQVLSMEEQRKLEQLALNSEDMMCFGVYLCLYTGLRLGELCALQWKDFDLQNACLHINKTILRISNPGQEGQKTRVVIDAPKTLTSKRVIPISTHLRTLLYEKRNEEIEQEACFLTGTKNYIEPRSYYNKYKSYLKKCGLPSYTFHILRHTFATRCIEKGVDPKALSEILGHADVQITLNRYVHPSLEHKRNCMELLIPIES